MIGGPPVSEQKKALEEWNQRVRPLASQQASPSSFANSIASLLGGIANMPVSTIALSAPVPNDGDLDMHQATYLIGLGDTTVHLAGADAVAYRETRFAVQHDPEIRRFMERLLPINWCRRLYPEAYQCQQPQ